MSVILINPFDRELPYLLTAREGNWDQIHNSIKAQSSRDLGQDFADLKKQKTIEGDPVELPFYIEIARYIPLYNPSGATNPWSSEKVLLDGSEKYVVIGNSGAWNHIELVSGSTGSNIKIDKDWYQGWGFSVIKDA